MPAGAIQQKNEIRIAIVIKALAVFVKKRITMNQYNKGDPKSIQKMFGSIAKQYDKTNAILSFQLCKKWNAELIVNMMGKATPRTYLDLCCGTGEISLNYLKKCNRSCDAYLLDFCPEMLECAKERAKSLGSHEHRITYLQADAQAIPLTKESIDCVTMAYGIRNIPQTEKCFREIYRILKHGGKIGILELTQPKNPILKTGHTIYLKVFMPLIGKLVTSNKDAYQYLCNSIKSFVKPEDLEKLLMTIGFKNTRIVSLSGGIATLLLAEK